MLEYQLSRDSYGPTDAPLYHNLSELGLELTRLHQLLPNGATVLNVGSGVTKRAEADLYLLRPDLRFLSIDPTVCILPEHIANGTWLCDIQLLDQYPYALYRRKTMTVNMHSFHPQEPEKGARLQQQRFNILNNIPGSIALEAPYLDDVANSSVDFGMDCRGGYQYMQHNVTEMRKQQLKLLYFKHIERILRPDGTMYIMGTPPSAIDNKFQDLEVTTSNGISICKKITTL